MSIVTPTTKLEAVNTLLAAIGESPVTSLTNPTGVDVVSAVQVLDDISRTVQLEGWLFNTEHDFPLSRDGEDNITVPLNALKVDITKNRFGQTDPVLRGQRVYDRYNHTYVFSEDLKAKVVFAFEYEELPETARNYITYRAARKYQQTSFGSDVLNAFNERDEMIARARFVDDQAEDEDLNFLRDTPGLNRILEA
jgi:hypothetical protein